MRLIPSVVLAASLAASLAPYPANASGLSFLHRKAIEGNRECFKEHMHHGRSGRFDNQAEAQVDAVRRWSRFTALEYGAAWGDFNVASEASVKCRPSALGGWRCNSQARPCRLIAVPVPVVAEPVTLK